MWEGIVKLTEIQLADAQEVGVKARTPGKAGRLRPAFLFPLQAGRDPEFRRSRTRIFTLKSESFRTPKFPSCQPKLLSLLAISSF